MTQKIDVTVAAVIERDSSFLLVEERVDGRAVLNQPAGHLEPGESLVEAVIRETLEETGFSFQPDGVVGIYLWRSPQCGTTFLRVAFSGNAEPPLDEPELDEGIIATHWLDRAQLFARESLLRSPLVLHCIDDHANQIRYPLSCLTHLDLAETSAALAVR